MVTIGVLSTVLLKSSLVAGKAGLLKLEWIFSGADLVIASSISSLEGLSSREAGLEVHPVLGGSTELLLLVLGLVSNSARDRHVLVMSYRKNINKIKRAKLTRVGDVRVGALIVLRIVVLSVAVLVPVSIEGLGVVGVLVHGEMSIKIEIK